MCFPDDLAAEIRRRYGLRGPAERIAAGLSGSDIWRLDSTPPVIVRVSRSWPPPDHVRRSCTVADSFARVIDQVPAPIAGRSGETVFLWHKCPVVLWPLIDGHALDRNDPTQLRLAARLLATLHRTALTLTSPAPDPSATTYATRPAGLYSPVVPPDPDLDDWLRNGQDHHRAGEPHGWMHGDFFDGNILCNARNTITGLIDWDDAQHGPLITELASALWEFTCTPARDTLTPQRVQDFLNAYVHAGGPVRPSPDIIPLIRERLRNAITFFRRLQAHGHKLDQDNEQAMIAAFTSLRHTTMNL